MLKYKSAAFLLKGVVMIKKISFLFLLSLLFLSSKPADAMKYEEALSSPKPTVLLIYADWADGLAPVMTNFGVLEQSYSESYNFVKMNIASPDTKVFNQKYHIYPNLPYVLLFRDGGKISRYLQKNCITDSACYAERLDFFNR